MADDGLNLLQIFARVAFSVALASYLTVSAVRLARYLGSVLPARPRVLGKPKRRIPPR
jgi:hypothetical protein